MMEKSATEIMQEALVGAVLDAVAAWKAASGGLANVLARDLGAVHRNTTMVDLPKEVQAALRDSTRATFNALLKEGYAVAKAGQPPRPSQPMPELVRDRFSPTARPREPRGPRKPPVVETTRGPARPGSGPGRGGAGSASGPSGTGPGKNPGGGRRGPKGGGRG